MKYCYSCKETKSKKDFYNNKHSKDGLFKRCKKCSIESGSLLKKKEVINKNEILTPIDGEIFKNYNEDLLVSNLGRVFKKYSEYGNKRYAHMMKKTLMNNGYYTISYYRKHLYVHRLVAETFLKNDRNLTHVNHIDCDKLNNNIDNLEWCTHFENINHSVKKDSYSVKLNRQQVLDIRSLKNKYSIKELSFKYNVSGTNIRLIINNKIWKHL